MTAHWIALGTFVGIMSIVIGLAVWYLERLKRREEVAQRTLDVSDFPHVKEALYRLVNDHEEAVKGLLSRCDDEMLTAVVAGLSVEEAMEIVRVTPMKKVRASALVLLARREREVETKEVLARGGAWCVFHGQDLAKCDPKAHGFDEPNDPAV